MRLYNIARQLQGALNENRINRIGMNDARVDNRVDFSEGSSARATLRVYAKIGRRPTARVYGPADVRVDPTYGSTPSEG